MDQPLVVCCGLAVVDHFMVTPEFPSEEGHTIASGFLRQGGGMAATCAVGLSRLGVPTAMWTALGDDAAGAEIVAGLKNEGVDTSAVRRLPGAASGLCVVLVKQGTGERSFVYFPPRGVSFPARPGDVPASARVLLFDETVAADMAPLLRPLRERGVATVCDFCRDERGVRECLELAGHVVLPEYFARRITGESEPARILASLTRFGGRAVITAGAGGAWYEQGGAPRHCPARNVNVLDTTGAGDAFHAGYCLGLVEGGNQRRNVELGQAVAAHVVQALGGRSNLPSRDDVLRLLAGQGEQDIAPPSGSLGDSQAPPLSKAFRAPAVDEQPQPLVVLHHEHPSGAHYDMLLYRRGVLKAWRIPAAPTGAETEPMEGTALPDHRPRYLTFEGDIGGGRGRVTARLRGEYVARAWGADCIEILLITAEFRAVYRLTRSVDNAWRIDHLRGEEGAQ